MTAAPRRSVGHRVLPPGGGLLFFEEVVIA
jgi:hypothetical protein